MTNTVGAASIEMSVDSTGVEAGVARVDSAVARTGRTIQNFGANSAAAIDGVAAGSNRTAARVDAATRSLIGSIQRTTATMEAGSRTSREYYEALANQRGVNVTALRPFLDQLDAVAARQRVATAAVDAANPALARVGVSAAQTAAALRGVPAQFTDIVTSLQGGQAPLTVFLQQGGQLRDMFGGAGAAARALGGYISGLITPVTAAAAVAAAAGVAYYQAGAQTDAFNRALVSTGNAAGTTAGQLSDMAKAISRSTGTQAQAAEALAALAGTGRIGAENLQRFGEVAVRAQKSLGISVADTAKAFADLGKSPLEASKKLDEQYGYLTLSVQRQLKSLQDLGRYEEAAALAQSTYAEAMEQRDARITSSMGKLETAWSTSIGAMKRVWGGFVDFFRDDTLSEQIDKAKERLAKATPNRLTFLGSSEYAEAAKNLKNLQDTEEQMKRIGAAQAENERAKQAGLRWDEEGLQYLSRKQQMLREIARAEQLGRATATTGTDPAETQRMIAARIAAIKEKYAEKPSASNDGIDAQIEAIKRRAAVEESVAKRSRDLLESNRAAGLVAEEQYILAIEALDVGAFGREKARLQEELRLAAAKPNSLKEQAALRGQIAAVEENIITRRLQSENQLNQLEVKRNRSAAENYANALEKQTSYRDSITGQVRAQEEANEQIGLSATALADLTATRLEDQAAIKEQNADIAEGIDLTGAMSAEYRAQAEALRDLARLKRDGAFKQAAVEATKEAEAAAKRMSEQIEEALTDSLMRGFESGKSFAENLRDTTINMFKTMVLRPSIQAIVTGNFSGGATGAAGGLGNATSLLSAGQTLWSGFSAGLNGSIGNIVSSAGNLAGSQWLSSVGAGISGGANTAGAAAAYAQAGNTAVSSGLTAGASIATYVPMVAAAVASYFGAKAIANGYKVEGIGNVLNFAGLAGGLVNRAFGRRGKETTAQGISGMFGIDSLENGTQYTDWIKKGGWFRSDKTGTDTAALDATKLAGLNTAYKAIKDSTAAFATALGVPADVVTSYTKQIKVALTGDETKDQALLAQMFSGIGDELANRVVPGLASFVKEGETASTALQRLTAEFKTVDAILDTLGVTSQQAFGSVGVASLAARDRLAQMAGGVDALAAQSSFFAQNFLTQAEQLAPTQKAVAEQMAAMGYASVTTSEQFKVAVQGLAQSGALATEAGAKAYAGLLAIAPAFKAVADAAAELEKKRSGLNGQIFDLTHSATEATARARQLELAALDASLRPLQKRVYALQDEAKALADNETALLSFVDSAMAGLTRAIGAQKAVVTKAYEQSVAGITAGIDGVNAAIAKTSSLSSSLKSTLSGLTLEGQEGSGRAAAQAQLEAALAIAKAGGVLPDADSIQSALATASRSSAADFASFLDYQRDFAKTASVIAELSGLTDVKLTDQQRQLEVLKDQKDLAQKAYEAEMERLDDLLTTAQQQVDAIHGVDNSVMTVTTAIATLTAAIGALKVSATPSNPTAPGMSVEGLYQSVLGRSADQTGLAFWTKAYGSSVDPTEIADFIKAAAPELAAKDNGTWEEWLRAHGVPGYAAGGAHAGGWRVVGENGPELENTGPSRIYSNRGSADLFAGMSAEIAELRSLMSVALSRLIGESKRGADAMENVDTRGFKTRDEMEIA